MIRFVVAHLEVRLHLKVLNRYRIFIEQAWFFREKILLTSVMNSLFNI